MDVVGAPDCTTDGIVALVGGNVDDNIVSLADNVIITKMPNNFLMISIFLSNYPLSW